MIELTDKQTEASALFRDHRTVLLEGGSRSGKTFIICAKMLVRAAKYPGTKHLSCRLRFNHAKQSLFYGTYRDVAKKLGCKIKENRSDWFIEVPTGGEPSEIWIGGLDDKERTEKILGNEYATIHINEASQITFDGYEILNTRLNPPRGVPPLLMIDYNPPSTSHWGFKIFHEGKDPVTDNELRRPERYGFLRMNPGDNIENLSEDYVDGLKDMSEAKRKRFLFGEYSDATEGALWQRAWIVNNRKKEPPGLAQIVIAVDPAVSNTETSDNTGIVVCGKDYNGHYYILGDHTYRGAVTGWGESVCALYDKYQANYVVAEVNNGGDLVTVNIKQYNNMIPVKQVRASRGKAIRAEPVAELYERGMVHHVGEFMDLEYQMTHWTTDDPESPDEMDALVWGVTYLMGRQSGAPLRWVRG